MVEVTGDFVIDRVRVINQFTQSIPKRGREFIRAWPAFGENGEIMVTAWVIYSSKLDLELYINKPGLFIKASGIHEQKTTNEIDIMVVASNPKLLSRAFKLIGQAIALAKSKA